MKRLDMSRRLLPLIMAVLLLSGCGRSGEKPQETTPSDLPENSTSPEMGSPGNSSEPPSGTLTETLPAQPSPAKEFYVAEVSGRNDDGSLLLTLCRPGEGMEETLVNFPDVEVYDYALSESQLNYSVPDQAHIARSEQGTWYNGAAKDIAVGDRVIIYSGDDGSVNIAHYTK